jgi:D-sedoheptulose 7-phosphate isomerase
MSDFSTLFAAHVTHHLDAVSKLAAETDGLSQMAEVWLTALKSGRKIIFFGNGGSAADAQHLAAELVVRYRINRKALAALALTTDTSILTAHSNDIGFESVFSRQIEALAQPGDVVVGISTSGNSPNVIAGLKAANEIGCVTIAFTSAHGGACAGIAQHCLRAPTDVTANAQECHLLVGHVLCEYVEQALAV